MCRPANASSTSFSYTVFSSFEKALERTKVEATLFLSPSVALDAMLFQKRGKFIELPGLANQRQEGEDQVVDGVEFQSLETIADHKDGAIASLCGQWDPLRELPLMLGWV